MRVSRWHRFVSAYQAVAVFLLNFLILLMVSTVVLAVLYAWKDRAKETRKTEIGVYSQHFDLESYVRIDRQTAVETGKEFDRMGEAESYRFYPWTVFSERAFDGRWVTVDSNGIRLGLPPQPSDDREPLVVWCFGGSTMFGWGQPNDQTIPAHLQTMLQSALPDRAVEVVNHGHSYWFSSMELNHFLALLRHHPTPDAILFLDGLNDSRMLLAGRHLPFFSHVADRAWETERRRRHSPLDGPWLAMGPSLPWLRATRALRSRLGFDPPRVVDQPDLEPVDVPTALSRYDANRRAIEALGAGLGIPVLQFLQPIPGYGRYAGPTKDLGPDVYGFYDQLVDNPTYGLIPIHDTLYSLERPVRRSNPLQRPRLPHGGRAHGRAPVATPWGLIPGQRRSSRFGRLGDPSTESEAV